MRKTVPSLVCLALLAPLSTLPCAAAQSGDSVLHGSYYFKAEASKVLSALARRANANIVIPEDIKTVVSVSLNDIPLEEAIRLVAAQAGVVYRKIGKTFIVAQPEVMKKTLEQIGVEDHAAAVNIDPAVAATALEKAVPYLTARPAGHSILLIGAPEDIARAKSLLRELDVPSSAEAVNTVSIALTSLKASDVLPALTDYGKVSAKAVGDSNLVLTGPTSLLQPAADFVRALDQHKETNSRFLVYKVKYVSVRSLQNTLRQAFQNITVVAGPEPFRIQRTRIDLSTGTTLGNSSSNGSSGGGSGSSSSLGGSSGGGGGSDQSGGGSGSDQSGGGSSTGSGTGRELGTRTIVIGGPEATVQAAIKLLNDIDTPTPQVALDVKVVSTNPVTTQNLGIDWSQSVSSTIFERPNLAPGATGNDFPNTSQPYIKNGFGLGNFGRLPISFSATLNAFFQRDDVRILAKPTITALDDEDGTIFVGETRRVSVSSLVNNAGANNVILNNVVEIPVGIILQMRPRVTEGDMISLRVHPIYSSGGAVDQKTGLFSTFNREAETTVRVRSGETIVIGGLLQDEDTKSLTKVPILGDLPFIGQIFRNHSRTHLRREVLVFVTPHLLKD